MHQVTSLPLTLVRVLQQHAESIRGVPQDDQSEEEVGHALRGLPLELWKADVWVGENIV